MIQIDTVGSARIIRLDRPERRNAMTFAMMDEIAAAVRTADADARVRGIVITGGDVCFSSGGDLQEALAMTTPGDVRHAVRRWQSMNDAIESAGKPVVAAIEGFCLTGGCELALACDLRVGAEGASFGITSSKIGTVPGAGGTQRLPRLIGVSAALHVLFSAEPIDAAEAYRLGLINQIVGRGQALSRACALVELYASRAPISLALIKRAVRQGVQTDLASGLELEGALGAVAYGTADKKEGISAFLEKRAPQFRGA
jgi:enoyl-CoA hydratase/carnithine racemase